MRTIILYIMVANAVALPYMRKILVPRHKRRYTGFVVQNPVVKV
jgi:hypothetical protein